MKECTGCGAVCLDTDAACGVCGNLILKDYGGRSNGSGGPTKTSTTSRRINPSVLLIPIIVLVVFGLSFSLTSSSPYNRFSTGLYILLGGLILTGSYVGKKAQSEGSFYLLTAPRSPPRVFPRNSPEQGASAKKWIAKTSAAFTADIIGISLAIAGILLMLV